MLVWLQASRVNERLVEKSRTDARKLRRQPPAPRRHERIACSRQPILEIESRAVPPAQPGQRPQAPPGGPQAASVVPRGDHAGCNLSRTDGRCKQANGAAVLSSMLGEPGV